MASSGHWNCMIVHIVALATTSLEYLYIIIVLKLNVFILDNTTKILPMQQQVMCLLTPSRHISNHKE